MPPRPTFLLRSIAGSSPPCPRQSSSFHTSSSRQSDSIPNYYDTLQLTPAATPAEIKRQFYALSKQYHPDRNRDDPTASTRFVAISEAYHVLAVPEKRAQYDAQFQHSRGSPRGGRSSTYPQGSYSSAAYGSRPASGLNKKRSTFRGPPPSFYNSGGYGKHGAKRAEHAYNFGGGFGPGRHAQGNRVPHFDDRRHTETHESINEYIRTRRQRVTRTSRAEDELNRGSTLLNFVVVSGAIGFMGMAVQIFGD